MSIARRCAKQLIVQSVGELRGVEHVVEVVMVPNLLAQLLDELCVGLGGIGAIERQGVSPGSVMSALCRALFSWYWFMPF